MSEARELLERFSQKLWNRMIAANRSGDTISGGVLCEVGAALDDALKLATQPEPGAVPELPEWSWQDDEGDLRIRLASKHMVQILDAKLSPDDLDRIAEACTKLAARERARRAGS